MALKVLEEIVWGPPMLMLILGIGVFLSLRTRFAQLRLLPRAVKSLGKHESKNGVTPRQAMWTALGATVGTGNLAGVAGAIALGGPGAVFWMWISGILGMITKCAEVTLAVRYRRQDKDGSYYGGPMYMMADGLHRKTLAGIYAFFGVVACLGVGNATQMNTLMGSFHTVASQWHIETPPWVDVILALLLAASVVFLLLGGGKRIGKTAERLVPLAAVGYILFAVVFLLFRFRALPAVLCRIVTGAFAPGAVTGGVVGSAFLSMRVGISRGVFTNEAGMGTASMAHAGADTAHPCAQGLYGILEVLIDTLVICTLTALVILTSGTPVEYGEDMGITLTVSAFATLYGSGAGVLIAAVLSILAFSTVLGWGLYGIRCGVYLFGEGKEKIFVFCQGITVLFGALMQTQTVWSMAQIVNGLMALPNVTSLFALSSEFTAQIREYSLTKKE